MRRSQYDPRAIHAVQMCLAVALVNLLGSVAITTVAGELTLAYIFQSLTDSITMGLFMGLVGWFTAGEGPGPIQPTRTQRILSGLALLMAGITTTPAATPGGASSTYVSQFFGLELMFILGWIAVAPLVAMGVHYLSGGSEGKSPRLHH